MIEKEDTYLETRNSNEPNVTPAPDAERCEHGHKGECPLITIFYLLNVRGLKPRSVPSRVPFISDILRDISQLFIGITETWLNDHQDAEIHIKGYTLFRQDRTRQKRNKHSRDSGGVALYIKNDDAINSEIIFSFSNGVVESLGVHIKSRDLVVIIVYPQPYDREGRHRSGNKEFKLSLNEIHSVLNNLPSPIPDVLLCGDFNLPHALWTNGTCASGATKDEQCMIQDLYALANEHFTTQLIDKPTHRAGNILDLIFTNSANCIHSFSTNITSMSDHHILECHTVYDDSVAEHVKCHPSEIEENEELSFYDFNFFHEGINWKSLKDAICQVNWRLAFHRCKPYDMMETFLSVCLDAVKTIVPRKQHQNGTKAGNTHKIPRHRWKLMRTRRRITAQVATCHSDARRAALKKRLIEIEKQLQASYKAQSEEEENRQRITAQVATCHSDARRAALKKRLIEIEKQLQASYKAQSEEEENKAVDRINSNYKYFYSYAKRFSKVKIGIGTLLDAANTLVKCPKKISEILSEQYSSVFSRPAYDSAEIYSLFMDEDTIPNGLSDIDFGEEDLIKAMNEFPSNSAAGPDGFPAMMLK